MNSSIYDCTVMHHRLEPKQHRFSYRIFMFYLDLNEIDDLSQRFRLFSKNRFNVFSFRDRDHLPLTGKTVKENISDFLSTKGVESSGMRICILTNLATFGYTFNPVSFYFCFDQENRPVCAVAEVGNTFGEQKLYFFDQEQIEDGAFRKKTTKYFYVSPFIDMDADFDFHLNVPEEKLNIQINDLQHGRKFFLSTLTGRRKPISDTAMLWHFLRFPFIPLQIITQIHWQAFKLFLKKLSYHKKQDQLELQREVFHGRHA
jgi:uncharacterized protein